MKRYQECNILEKFWRRRHYAYIPFRWCRFHLLCYFNNDKSKYNGRYIWRLYIGEAQCDMNWTYTSDEVREHIDKLKNLKDERRKER